MKKNNLVIIIVVVLVIIAGVAIGNHFFHKSACSRSSEFSIANSPYADPTTSVTKLFFADKSGHQVLLQRTDNGWLVDNQYPANQKLVDEMLYTVDHLRITAPVSVKKNKNIITHLSTTNTKVEIYQILPRINLFNVVKLFYHETRSRVFYIGGTTQDNQNTYILKEGDENVYMAHLPGFRGSISARFSANPTDWRDHVIYDVPIGDIESVKLEITDDPDNGFIIKENGRYQYTMNRLNGEPVDFSDNKVLSLLSSFTDVRFESFLYDIEPARRDSIINSPFQQRLTLTTKDGKSSSVTTFRLRTNSDIYDYSEEDLDNFHDMLTDPDHKYALISEGNEFVLIQDFVFGKLLKPADYYSKDYHEEIPQIYYKELETVESR
ncbi:MAG: DUF4340 domain-containing protein [Bacteroidales bacterium]|nr:DUF4340 domain-containing protein [Bacteroidales bacterium]